MLLVMIYGCWVFNNSTPNYSRKAKRDLKSVRVHFAYGRIALTLELLGRFGRFLDEDDRYNPPVLLISFPRLRGFRGSEAPRALDQKLTVLP